jgi:hypothetical protein
MKRHVLAGLLVMATVAGGCQMFKSSPKPDVVQDFVGWGRNPAQVGGVVKQVDNLRAFFKSADVPDAKVVNYIMDNKNLFHLPKNFEVGPTSKMDDIFKQLDENQRIAMNEQLARSAKLGKFGDDVAKHFDDFFKHDAVMTGLVRNIQDPSVIGKMSETSFVGEVKSSISSFAQPNQVKGVALQFKTIKNVELRTSVMEMAKTFDDLAKNADETVKQALRDSFFEKLRLARNMEKQMSGASASRVKTMENIFSREMRLAVASEGKFAHTGGKCFDTLSESALNVHSVIQFRALAEAGPARNVDEYVESVFQGWAKETRGVDDIAKISDDELKLLRKEFDDVRENLAGIKCKGGSGGSTQYKCSSPCCSVNKAGQISATWSSKAFAVAKICK